jgi:putative nucleotidyltransferase with HDIG domain
MRAKGLRMKGLLSRGTNGNSGYTPLGPALQGLIDRSFDGRPAVARVTDRTTVYLGALIVLATGLAMISVRAGYTVGDLWAVVVLAVVAAVSEKQRVTIGKDTEASISLIPILFAAVLFGPLAGMIVAAVSNLGAFCSPYMKWAIFTCSHSITGSVAGFVAAATLALTSGELLGYILATALAALAAELSETVFFGLTMKMRRKDPIVAVKSLAPVASASVLLYAPLVAILAVAYERISPLTLILFLAPALAAQRLFGLYQEQRRLTDDLEKANVRLERANLSFATALVATLDARDRYTAGHSAAVAIYARDIAARLGLPEDRQQLAHVCGLVHDIGKIGLKPGLLEKPGALTLDERREMEKHSAIGERILANVEDYAEIATIVRHHHERWDGQGYPDGLIGDDIPMIARIIAAADAYNAMTSDRPYRDAMPSRVARLRLAQGVESQFDTAVIAAFEALLAGASEDYRLATRDDFTLVEQDRYTGRPYPARAPEIAEAVA